MQQFDPKQKATKFFTMTTVYCQILLRDDGTRYQRTRVNRQVTGKEVRHLAGSYPL